MKSEEILNIQGLMKQLGCLRLFVSEYKRCHNCHNVWEMISDRFDSDCKYISRFDDIDSSFSWSFTVQGYKYWTTMSSKLKKLYFDNHKPAKDFLKAIEDAGLRGDIINELAYTRSRTLFVHSINMSTDSLMDMIYTIIGIRPTTEQYIISVLRGSLFPLSKSLRGSKWWEMRATTLLQSLKTPLVLKAKRTMLLLRRHRLFDSYAEYIRIGYELFESDACSSEKDRKVFQFLVGRNIGATSFDLFHGGVSPSIKAQFARIEKTLKNS